MVFRFEVVPVILGIVSHPGDQVADGNARKGDTVIIGMVEDVHQGDHSSVAPTHDSHAAGIEEGVVLQHVIPGIINIFVFQSAIIYFS